MMNNKRLIRGLVFAVAVLLIPVTGFADEAADPDPGRFEKGIAAFERWDAKNAWSANPILFVGSSSIRMWQTREAFPEFPVLNRGFGGAHISDVLHFFDRIVKPYAPRLIVFYCGDNDIAAGKSPERVHADYRRFVERVRAAIPATSIVYLPIKPSGSRWKHWPAMDEANKLIRQDIDADPKQTYVDTATCLLGEDGEPDDGLFLKDRLHLSEAGYKLWNERVLPVIAAMR